MRATKNEKILLAILFAVAFVIVNYLAFEWYAKKQASLRLAVLQLQADEAEAKVDLQEVDLWKPRLAWIHEHEPVLGEESEAKVKVLNNVLKGASDNKLTVMEQSLNEVQRGPAGSCVNVTVKIKGSMEGLCKWLTDLQKPDDFYAITSFSLKADEDQKSMICSLHVARYFKDK